MKLKLFTTAAFFALSSGAMAADAVDAKIQELFSQGYTHFQVKRGATSSKIEAYSSTQPKLEMRLSSSSGAVLSQSIERDNDTDHSGDIARISATAGSYSDHENDDGHDGYDDDNRGTTGTSVSGSDDGYGWDDNGSDNDDDHGSSDNDSNNDDHGGSNNDGGNDDHGGSDDDGGNDDHDGNDDD
ncbi:hypothetical protein RYZ20_04000 [Thioclava sp. A2]|uniref:hypothetical protein n=1 Tax=Thioclava sp. FCG-A2 TaxID=3080562 RepID=UPI002952B490|nr:hypothetical protein [Thioclava sp. A2]MDV7270060.1 hypothetical protein [Thioclava sp. A2]